MPAPEAIKQLVERFHNHIDDYKSGKYNETEVRRDFIDPMFEALDWDIANKEGRAEQYREVIHEDAIKIGGTTKAPDYCFTLSGKRMFFVEAKKPSVNIEKDIAAAYQVRRYAWTAKHPLAILTDFEEFAVYDCRVKPKPTDKAYTARVLYIKYDEYLDRWDEIAGIFTKEAIHQGSFDRFASKNGLKKGTAEVDDEFLSEIESWRDLLATNIALRNKDLNQRQLNYVVQRVIDRIIFLRICEDRGIEESGQLKEIRTGKDNYQRMIPILERADKKYNSGLFHFKKEKDQATAPDELSLSIKIDDKVIKKILSNLYYPESPYEFSVLPAEILGQVYEKFLGKVIRLTKGHRAKVEDKPEVKKAGGVYYTPTYIVDYIVKNTVGKLVEGKTPRQVAKLTICDPACGSGSFLLGAYQYLLDWHRDYYTGKSSPKYKNLVFQGSGGEWRLTTQEKKRILLNNIYGVDIDPQAVEVTKLSLLLKVLEGENEDTLNRQLSLLRERALPDLGGNIKCGNSLIGPDFYKDAQIDLLDDEAESRLNVFDWRAAFPRVFSSGGFDVIIGNPPYLRIQGLQEYHSSLIEYFSTHFTSAVKRFDFYLLFAEKGFELLADGGLLGFICPHKFLNSDFGSGLRGYFIENAALKRFISFGNNMVFEQASTYTGILVLEKGGSGQFRYSEMPYTQGAELATRLANLGEDDFANYSIRDLTSKPWVLTSSSVKKVLDRIVQPTTLGEVFKSVSQGIVTGVDEIYFLGRTSAKEGEIVEVYSVREEQTIQIERDILKPLLKGDDVARYTNPRAENYTIYPYRLEGRKTLILQEDELSENYPQAYEYLSRYKNELRELRVKYKTNPKYWYSCHRGRSIEMFESERIVTPEIANGCNMTISPGGLYHNTVVYSLLPEKALPENIFYWLGILNSRVMWWFLSNTGTVLRGGYFRFKTNYMKPFPVKRIDFESREEKKLHDNIVSLVQRIMKLYERMSNMRIPQEKEATLRQVDIANRTIDNLVYELYGLDEEERGVVGAGD